MEKVAMIVGAAVMLVIVPLQAAERAMENDKVQSLALSPDSITLEIQQ